MLDSFHVFILPDLLPMLLGIAQLALRKGQLGHYRCHVAFLCSAAFLSWKGAVLYQKTFQACEHPFFTYQVQRTLMKSILYGRLKTLLVFQCFFFPGVQVLFQKRPAFDLKKSDNLIPHLVAFYSPFYIFIFNKSHILNSLIPSLSHFSI